MAEPVCPDVIVHVCHNCIAPAGQLPRQWTQGGLHVLVREVPCSGKTNVQYFLHAFEGGVGGVCVVACPKGQCRLAEGNYRAEIRIGLVRRLLAELGLEPQRAELLHCGGDDPPERLGKLVEEAVGRLIALGENPLRARKHQAAGTK